MSRATEHLHRAVTEFARFIDENPVERLRRVAEYFIKSPVSVDPLMAHDVCWALGVLIRFLTDEPPPHRRSLFSGFDDLDHP